MKKFLAHYFKYKQWIRKRKIKKYFKPYITLVIGKSGSGKSTFLASMVAKANKFNYPVYSTHYIKGAMKIKPADLGKYLTMDCVIIADEIQIEWDNRNFKSLSDDNKFFISHHRHFNSSVFLGSQSYEDTDIKARRQARKIFMMIPFLPGVLCYQKIRMKFGISEDGTAIITKFSSSVFAIRFKLGFLYWRRFNSFSLPDLPKLPIEYW